MVQIGMYVQVNVRGIGEGSEFYAGADTGQVLTFEGDFAHVLFSDHEDPPEGPPDIRKIPKKFLVQAF